VTCWDWRDGSGLILLLAGFEEDVVDLDYNILDGFVVVCCDCDAGANTDDDADGNSPSKASGGSAVVFGVSGLTGGVGGGFCCFFGGGLYGIFDFLADLDFIESHDCLA